MLTVKTEMHLEDFRAWSGGADTLDMLIEHGLCDKLEEVIEDFFPEGMTDTELNDLLWFDRDNIWYWLNIDTDEDGMPIFED